MQHKDNEWKIMGFEIVFLVKIYLISKFVITNFVV